MERALVKVVKGVHVEDLRLASEVQEAAEKFSAREDLDVEVRTGDGSTTIYSNGAELEPISVRSAAPMPVWKPGKPVAFTDLTPNEIRTGHWSSEAEAFIPSRGPMSPKELLMLSAQSERSRRAS